MTIYVDPTGIIPDELSAVIGGSVQVVELGSELEAAIGANPSEAVVVFSADADEHEAFGLATAQRVMRPQLAVILLRRRVDAALLGAAMRAGVREVIREASVTALAEACLRARSLAEQVGRHHDAAQAPSGSPAGKVVTVFSAKGGCGKTTVATNIAAALAADKRRVCLVDLDLPFGDVAIMLQLHLERTIADAVAMTGHMDELGARSIVSTHSSGLDVIVAPLEPADAERITPALVTDLLGQLKSMYEVVVVDTPPAFTEAVLAALDMTDLYLLVATLDISAVKNLKLTLEMLEMLNHSIDKQRIIVNRSDAKVGLTVSDVQQALRRSISAEIPSSRDVPATINKGVPLVLEQPNHPVSVALRTLATRDICPRQTTMTLAGKAAHAKRTSFLRRGSAPA